MISQTKLDTLSTFFTNFKVYLFCILGELIDRIEEMGREDVVKVLKAGCSIYRIITLEESMSLQNIVDNDDSLLIQQQQQQNHHQQQQQQPPQQPHQQQQQNINGTTSITVTPAE